MESSTHLWFLPGDHRDWHAAEHRSPRNGSQLGGRLFRHVCYGMVWRCGLPPGKHTKNYGKPPVLMGKLTISMAIFNSYFDITRGYASVPMTDPNGAAIYGVPWIPSIYLLYVSINIPAPWIRHGLCFRFVNWKWFKWFCELLKIQVCELKWFAQNRVLNCAELSVRCGCEGLHMSIQTDPMLRKRCSNLNNDLWSEVEVLTLHLQVLSIIPAAQIRSRLHVRVFTFFDSTRIGRVTDDLRVAPTPNVDPWVA